MTAETHFNDVSTEIHEYAFFERRLLNQVSVDMHARTNDVCLDTPKDMATNAAAKNTTRRMLVPQFN